jgi:hypothetical protein
VHLALRDLRQHRAAVDLHVRERADTADLDIELLLRGHAVSARRLTTADTSDHLVHVDLTGAGKYGLLRRVEAQWSKSARAVA